MTQNTVSQLQRKIYTLEQQGVLSDGWIASYTPAGTAKGQHTYYQLRSRIPFANGKRTRHISQAELPVFQKLVHNGRELKRLRRQLQQAVNRQKTTPRHALTSSAHDEWYTPPEYIDGVRRVLGNIDLDPASHDTAQQWIQADHHMTVADNGLEQRWWGRVWLNPPYGRHILHWTEKLVTEYRSGNVTEAILLVRPAVASAWYQALAGQYVRCEPHKRIRFIRHDRKPCHSPVHGNTFFYVGKHRERFHAVFSTIGTISVPFEVGSRKHINT